MTENVNRKDNCPDELICPITLQLFVDPVRAKDGHVYEREAITRWIFEHGTSPLTREPLTINDLVSDQRLKSLSRQRRNSTVSFNSQNSTVIVPAFRNIFINNRQIVPQTNDQNRLNNQIRFYSNRLIFFIILFSFIFPVSFIIGIVLGLQNSYSQDIEIRSTYSDSLTANNSYNRSGYSNDYYYYKKYQINIITSGFYAFEIDSQTDIRINGDFYIYYFNSNQSNENLLTYSYKDQIYKKTYLGNQFQSQVYILVITTYLCCKEGSFSILVTGPNTITFQ